MDEIRAGIYFDRLIKRREQVVMTLRHLDGEQAQVEKNTDWLDQAAYESRVALLDRLVEWYNAEMIQLDKALGRIERHAYGLCAACHDPIAPQRLASAPEAEFCGECQGQREGLESR